MTEQWGAVPPPPAYPPPPYPVAAPAYPPPPPYPPPPTYPYPPPPAFAAGQSYPATPMHPSTLEFDTFGPWIMEVASPEEIPRLYGAYAIDFASTRLVLKVPRDIVRREAHPGMDLYDHLLIVRDETFTVLTRLEGPRGVSAGFNEATIRLADIAAIIDSVDLLDGRLSILAVDNTVFNVRYNGSARATARELVELLRGLRAANPPGGSFGAALLQSAAGLLPGMGVFDYGRDDVILVHDFQELAKTRPELRPWTCHGGQRLGGGVGPVIAPYRLTGMMLGSDGSSLEIIARREAIARVRTADHSHGRTLVPLDAITAITEYEHPRWPMLVTMTLALGEAQVQLVVPRGCLAHRLLASAMGRGWR